MKNENLRDFFLLFIGLVIVSGFFYLKWDSFLDLANNLLNFKNSHPSQMISFDKFLSYLESGNIKKADLYENAEILVFDGFNSLGEKLEHIGVKVPVRNSSLILELREYQIDFNTYPSISFNSIWSILSALIIPLLILFVVQLFLSLGSYIEAVENANAQAQAEVELDESTIITFKDVAGIDEAKQELEEFVSFLKTPEIFKAVGATPPKGVILVGPPGTGKTLLAKAIAGEADVPFFSISGSEFIEMYVGIGAARVRSLFDIAEQNSPSILFIDEIDAIGRQRGNSSGGNNDEREQTLNQILTEMDGFQPTTGIIVIAATNRVDVLDSALLRPGRFDRQITVFLPTVSGRREILKVHSRDKKIDAKTSFTSIAQRTPGFSGADLCNMLNEASILTARANLDIITPKEIYAAIDRIVAGLEGVVLKDSRTKRLLAYHEVGHALAGTLLKNHNAVQKVTLIPRGRSQGLTWFKDNEQPLMTRSQLSSRLIAILAGRAAEKIVFGNMEITNGASDDFFKVNSLARQMVTRFGMSKLTPMSMEFPKSTIFMSRSTQNRSECFLDIADKIDLQIIEIIEDGFEKASVLLERNRVLVDQLTVLIMQVETIEGDAFEQFVSNFTSLPEEMKIQPL
uniref:putative chloroplast ATP-dependent protease n=1 Tax=Ascoseira mirabilis TaxID=76830 RepID=UPI0030035E40|nr:putative chloroplast ATP-dependent protease [Ascoseira mirabilis]